MNDPTLQVGLAFLSVGIVGTVLSTIGWLMSRSADRTETQPDLAEKVHTQPVKVGKM